MSEKSEIAALNTIHRRSVVILMLLATFTAMKLAASILAPIAIAAFLVALAWPIKSWLNKRLPDSLSYIGSFIGLGGVLAIFVGGIFLSGSEIIEVAPEYQKEVAHFWKQTKTELATNGVDTNEKMKMAELRNIASYVLSNFQQTLLILVLVVAYVALALPEVTSWRGKLRGCLGKDRSSRILSASEQLGKSFQTYLVSMLICGIISGAATCIAAYFLGLDLIFTLSLMAFILNFIPIIGAFLTILAPVMVAIVQFDGAGMPTLVFCVMGAIHMFIGNIIEPKIQGNMLSMSPLIVLISLSVWGFLWGVPGALLAAPLTHGIIIACSHYERTRWVACLLSNQSQPPIPESDTENK